MLVGRKEVRATEIVHVDRNNEQSDKWVFILSFHTIQVDSGAKTFYVAEAERKEK